MPGGIGNQLFALFASRYFSENSKHAIRLDFSSVDRHHAPLGHDIRSLLLKESEVNPTYSPSHEFLRHFYYPKNILSRQVLKYLLIQNRKVFDLNLDRVNYVDQFLIASTKERKLPLRVSGYFGDFGFYNRLTSANQRIALKNPSKRFINEMTKINSVRTLGIHLRLGDFLSSPNSIGILSDSYYTTSIRRFLNDYDRILVFTNDYRLGKKRIEEWGVNTQIEILDSNCENDPLEDLLLMSACSGLILSNSTFSFWAGKLSGSERVIYPMPFRKDNLTEIASIPETWLSHPSAWK